MKNYDDEIRMLMRRESVSYQLTAFLLAAVYGAVSGAAALTIRETALNIVRQMIYSAELEINQYHGFANMAEIGVSVALVGIWLILVLIVWHRIGKADQLRQRLCVCGKWCVAAIAVFAVFRVAGIFI